MIIECFGLPGAGKSTVTELFAKESKVFVVPKYVSKRYGMYYALLHPRITTRWLLVSFIEGRRVGGFKLARFKLAVFFHTLSRYQWARMHNQADRLVILDEGLAQRLLGLYEKEMNEQHYQGWVKHLPGDTTIVQILYTGNQSHEVRVGTFRQQLSQTYQASWRQVLEANHVHLGAALSGSSKNMLRYERDEADVNYQALMDAINTQLS